MFWDVLRLSVLRSWLLEKSSWFYRPWGKPATALEQMQEQMDVSLCCLCNVGFRGQKLLESFRNLESKKNTCLSTGRYNMYNTSSINISGILCSFGLLLVSVCCAYPCSSQKTSQLGCPRATRQVTRLQVHVLQETVKGPRRSKAQRVQHGTAWYSMVQHGTVV